MMFSIIVRNQNVGAGPPRRFAASNSEEKLFSASNSLGVLLNRLQLRPEPCVLELSAHPKPASVPCRPK
jgi:hypothetical protein